VARLSRGLDLPPWRFAAVQPQPERTATAFLLEPGGPTHALVLGVRPPSDAEPGCIFLQGGRCSVYSLRPRACRRFPAAERRGKVVAREGIVCGTARWEGAMGRRSWRAELERERREVALHAVAVLAWNERIEQGRAGALELDHYLEHLEDAWSVVARLRETLPPRERSGEAFLGRVREILRELPVG
jgi:Fe-S-cluster containining protein